MIHSAFNQCTVIRCIHYSSVAVINDIAFNQANMVTNVQYLVNMPTQ